MVVVLIGLAILSFVGIKKRNGGSYTSKEASSSLIGLFVIIIFFSHVGIDMPSIFDKPLSSFCHTLLSQLMVVPFLFFSGFGIVKQYKKRGSNYLRTFPLNRILKIYLIYLVSIIIRYFVFKTYNTTDIFCWDNWFIFVILFFYISIWLILSIFKDKKIIISFLILLSAVLLSVFLFIMKKHYSWYNTTIAFPLGVIYSLHLEKINNIFKKRAVYISLWIVSAFLFVGSFAILYLRQNLNFALYLSLWFVKSATFMLIIMLFLFKFTFGNAFLRSISKYSLWFYLLQFIVFDYNKYLFVIVSLITTFLFSFLLSKTYSYITSFKHGEPTIK